MDELTGEGGKAVTRREKALARKLLKLRRRQGLKSSRARVKAGARVAGDTSPTAPVFGGVKKRGCWNRPVEGRRRTRIQNRLERRADRMLAVTEAREMGLPVSSDAVVPVLSEEARMAEGEAGQGVVVVGGRVPARAAGSTPPALDDAGRQELRVALQKGGVTKAKLVRVAVEAMDADTRRRAGNGEYEVAPDHDTRLKAVAQAREMMELAGEIPVKADESGPRVASVRMAIVLPDGTRGILEVGG